MIITRENEVRIPEAPQTVSRPAYLRPWKTPVTLII